MSNPSFVSRRVRICILFGASDVLDPYFKGWASKSFGTDAAIAEKDTIYRKLRIPNEKMLSAFLA